MLMKASGGGAACCSACIFLLSSMHTVTWSDNMLQAISMSLCCQPDSVKQWESSPHPFIKEWSLHTLHYNVVQRIAAVLVELVGLVLLCFYSKHRRQPHLMSLLSERKLGFIELSQYIAQRRTKSESPISTWERLQPWQWLSLRQRIRSLKKGEVNYVALMHLKCWLILIKLLHEDYEFWLTCS